MWYGPDTYMGANLASLLATISTLPDADVAALHPEHSAASVADALTRLRYFDQGTCIVHHLFGGEVCDMVRSASAAGKGGYCCCTAGSAASWLVRPGRARPPGRARARLFAATVRGRRRAFCSRRPVPGCRRTPASLATHPPPAVGTAAGRREGYRDAYLAAHFEVPGEMFALAMEARARGMGCVGSTQNILDFIAAR